MVKGVNSAYILKRWHSLLPLLASVGDLQPCVTPKLALRVLGGTPCGIKKGELVD